jgi:hypothetical protein
LQQNGFGVTDLLSWFQQQVIGDDFDGTTSNLGWDVQGLEERSLGWFLTGVTSWNNDANWGDGTLSGWGTNFVLVNNVTNFGQWSVGEYNTDVTLE